MALPTVVINNDGTGSDTLASGAPSSFTRINGTAAATAASTVVTLLVDNPDLSGVATDGSAVLWVGSSSGRQFSKITAKDNTGGVKTVTVADAYANTESGKAWGIGGKRATIASSLRLFQDVKAGWTVDIQDGGSSYVITASILCPVSDGGRIFVTSTSVTRPTITCATDNVILFDPSTSYYWTFQNLKLTHTAGTRGNGISPLTAACADLTVRNCIIDGCKYGIESDNVINYPIGRLSVSTTEILNSVIDGATVYDGSRFTNCYIHNNGGNGIKFPTVPGSLSNGITMTNDVIADNTLYGVYIVAENPFPIQVDYCDFVRNGNSGILTGGTGDFQPIIRNSIFYSNGTYGIQMGAGTIRNYDLDYNAYGANGVAPLLTFTSGPHDVTLTGDPFNSSTDFGLNNNAGAGAACKLAGAPVLNATTQPAADMGAIPTGGGAANAGGMVRNRVFTGF